MKTIQRDTLINVINTSKWNHKTSSSNSQEGKKEQQRTRTTGNKQNNNKMADLIPNMSETTLM